MRDVSAAFLRTIRGSHRPVFRAIVCETFQTGSFPTGIEVPIIDGTVTVDGTAEVRSMLELTVPGVGGRYRRTRKLSVGGVETEAWGPTMPVDVPALWPTRADSLYAPYGNEVYVQRGVQLSDDRVDMVGLGYFRIETAEQTDAPNGAITLTGSDRMAGIVKARLLAPRQYSAGSTLGSIIDDLVLEVYPDATIEWDDPAVEATALARSIICERERFEFADDLVRAQGKVWYWDHRGVLLIRSTPDESDPVFDIEYGHGAQDEGGLLVALARSLTSDGVYNAVVATGEGADSEAPAYGVALDNNAESPTYFFGDFGQVPKFYASQFLASDAQAEAAAAEMVRQESGLPYSVDLTLSPNPALEPWDPVTVRASGTESTERHLLAILTIPLAEGAAMSAQTRQKTVVLIGSSPDA